MKEEAWKVTGVLTNIVGEGELGFVMKRIYPEQREGDFSGKGP